MLALHPSGAQLVGYLLHIEPAGGAVVLAHPYKGRLLLMAYAAAVKAIARIRKIHVNFFIDSSPSCLLFIFRVHLDSRCLGCWVCGCDLAKMAVCNLLIICCYRSMLMSDVDYYMNYFSFIVFFIIAQGTIHCYHVRRKLMMLFYNCKHERFSCPLFY